jgi:hypothetical protein
MANEVKSLGFAIMTQIRAIFGHWKHLGISKLIADIRIQDLLKTHYIW